MNRLASVTRVACPNTARFGSGLTASSLGLWACGPGLVKLIVSAFHLPCMLKGPPALRKTRLPLLSNCETVSYWAGLGVPNTACPLESTAPAPARMWQRGSGPEERCAGVLKNTLQVCWLGENPKATGYTTIGRYKMYTMFNILLSALSIHTRWQELTWADLGHVYCSEKALLYARLGSLTGASRYKLRKQVMEQRSRPLGVKRRV